jgi:anaerobic selenocysteine-containing dehydrogenase
MGMDGEKGGRQWSPISWDEALDTIADEFTKNRDCHGPESVAFI